MSLHLIESKKLQSQSNRKRGGTTASVVLHVVLVVGAFTAASAAPVLDKPSERRDIVYVAPEPPPAPQRVASRQTGASEANCDCYAAKPMTLVDLKNLSLDIPTVSVDVTLEAPVSELRAEHGTPHAEYGDGRGRGTGAGPTSGIMNESQVELPVAILSGYKTPRYPEGLRLAGVEETLSAMFVVDTLGRIEGGSLEIPNVKNPQFISSVRDALANARFKPAEVHGMRVRQRVIQAFVFSLQRD